MVRVVAGMPREISMALLRCHASASADDQCRVGGVATPGDCVPGRAAGGSANRDAQQRHQSVLRADIHDVRHDFCNKVRHHGVSPWLHVGLITRVCACMCSIRIAFHLGGGHVRAAKRVVAIAGVACSFSGVAVAMVFIFGRDYIGRVFSNDPAVWAMAKRISLLVGAG